jgi:serine/threonine protein kinase
MSGLPDPAVSRLRRLLDEPDVSGTRYVLREELGRGGMGAVYAAEDRELGRQVALKVLPPWDGSGASAAAERLRQEARILAQLEHPGIVPIHDAGVLPDGRVFYAMKRVEGRRLDQVRADAARSDLLRLFLKVCDPVAFAHSRQVIHRDLKPENVLVGAFGEVLVLDWGIARMRSAECEVRNAEVAGTPGYMAPEQAAGKEGDERTDVYGLGGILYFLLVGRAPGAEPAAPRRLDRSITKPLEAICMKALARDPAARYGAVADLQADVARFLDGAAVSAYRETPLEVAARWVTRHRTLVYLVLAYLIMRAILFFFLGR